MVCACLYVCNVCAQSYPHLVTHIYNVYRDRMNLKVPIYFTQGLAEKVQQHHKYVHVVMKPIVLCF